MCSNVVAVGETSWTIRTDGAHCRINRLNQQTIGVYGGQDLAAILREKCPDFFFADAGPERDGCRICVFDPDEPTSDARKCLARIILGPPGDRDRRPGELYVERNTFLGNPIPYLMFGTDLVEAAVHAAQLEIEVNSLKQIHDLMSMTDADAVSERIT